MSLLLPSSAPAIPRFNGTLIGPDDEGYEEARHVHNQMIDRRPALIARCHSVPDIAAAQEHGLAVTGGRVSSTGVAGFTIGSGSGWLERKMGLAADNLRAARVLTAEGVIVTASETENPDLFWALRGGGGNFGIVVEFEFALRPVGPIVLGGMMIWPRDRAREVMTTYRELMRDAPDALGGGLALMSAPP